MMTVDEIEHAIAQLPLEDLTDPAALIERRRRELGGPDAGSVSLAPEAPDARGLVLRDHAAFLNSYASEDEALYDDAAAG